ncbi:MAG: cation diffusion facilitator family transporter [Ruminococcus sp.]|nr:cation diffusion facilitator family transporter [Ruminococcus sp.]MCM1480572.1 cation diffusion facilitator family transporter [Muribaculaceae bacterium]
MINFLAKKFIHDSENTSDKNVRQAYCVMGGILGTVCNLFLFALKLVIGAAMKSIAITSDAFNNLSDTGSCIVAIIGAKMANRLPDRQHPFGHGRIEYISSLIVSFIILLVGFELFKSSCGRIANPEPLNFNGVMTVILAASVFVKLFMYFCYNSIAKKINSTVMKASAKDSVNDVISTSAVIVTTVIGNFLPFQIDGFIGVLIAAYIMYSGVNMAKETIDLLLGAPPSKETINALSEIILAPDEIVGLHDLMVHDYGPGRVFASVHAEVPDDADAVHIHEIIDATERRIFLETGIQTVIHSDPVSINNEYVDGIKNQIMECISNVDPAATMHDFRITDGKNRINVIFDMAVTVRKPEESQRIVDRVKELIAEKDSRFFPVITVDEVFYE